MPISRLVVETREVDPVAELLPFTSPTEPLAWLRRGDGIVGFGGVAAELSSGAEGMPRGDARADAPALADAWRALAADAVVDDPVRL
ncbi:MAG: isochorismate synthase, partial [Microbacterium sp.]